MKGHLLRLLRTLAQAGALNARVPCRSVDLERQLGVSQQSISNYLIALEESRHIERRLGARLQSVTITRIGRAVLEAEFHQYQAIFGEAEVLSITGVVETGIGDGAYYLSFPEYVDQIEAHFGFRPFPGTLNMVPDRASRDLARDLAGRRGVLIEGFRKEGRTFGAVMAFGARFQDHEGAVIFPLRAPPDRDVVEVIAPLSLRKTYGLEDGARVEVKVRLH